MTIKMSCKGCAFSSVEPVEGQLLIKARVCRRMPPTPIMQVMKGQVALLSLHPIVEDKDYCFLFSPVDTAPADVPMADVTTAKSN